MAILRSYSATFEQTGLSSAAVARFRFNEGTGTDAQDSIHGIDGSYETGAAPGAAGSIGDGAASFDGTTGFVLVETLSGTITVSAFGDSEINGVYSGGNSVAPADRFSPTLEAALAGRGLDATVVNQGVSGDTSEQGLLRVDDVVDDNPDVVILEFGTNDALQTVNPDTVETNLRSIIDDLQTGGVEQILLTGAFGFYPQRNGGTGYATEQNRSALEGKYSIIANGTSGVVLLNDVDGSPMFLGGERIAGVTPDDDTIEGGVLDSADTSLSVGDGLHPNAAGVDDIVERVLPQTIALGAAAGVVNEPLLLANGAFEMVFTLDNLGQTQQLFAKDSAGRGTGGEVAAIVNQNGSLTFALSDGSDVFFVQSASGEVEAGTPTHLVATFGSNGMHLFINGLEVDSDPYSGGLDAGLGNFEQLVIGAGNGLSTPGTIDLNQFFDGTIDEFAVYDRALSEGEVRELFEGGEFGTTVVGTAGADTIIGGSDDEDLRGDAGDDQILGQGGDDALRGGGGDDDLRGGVGNDKLFAGRGDDLMLGGAGDDRLAGLGGADSLSGGAGEDLLDGGGGGDALAGGGDADQLFGGTGIDRLSGGGGDDLLNGDAGRDSLRGGAGADTFQIDRINDGVDKIQDFAPGDGDVLNLSAVLNFSDGDDVNDFVQLNATNGNTSVDVNPNGTGANFTTVFNLIGVIGLDIGNLVDDGNVQLTSPSV